MSINLPTPIWILLGLLPLLLVIISWVLKIKFRKPETVAYGCNGSKWVKWLFLLWVIMVILNEWVAPHIPNHWLPQVGRNDGVNFIIHGFTLYCFICYFFISFRELDANQAADAKSAKGLVVSLAKSAGSAVAAAGSASATGLGLIWSAIMAAAYPIVSITSTTITYVSTGAAMFFASLIPMIFVGVIIAMIGAFLILVLFFCTFVIMYIIMTLKFLLNLRITFMGPSSVRYRVKKDDDD